MENNKDKSTDKASSKGSSGEPALERGKAAIKADEQINSKDLNDPKVEAEKKKDAEQWRNEG